MNSPNNECWSFANPEQPSTDNQSHRLAAGTWLQVMAMAIAGCSVLAIVNRSRTAEQRLAIEAIRQSGGSVTTSHSTSGRAFAYGDHSTFGPVEAIEIFDPRIVEAEFWKCGVFEYPEALLYLRAPLSDGDLPRLRHFRNLRALELCGAPISSEGCRHLRLLSRLEELNLSSELIDDSQLHHIADLPRLRVLTLSSTQMTDEGLRTICQLRSLRELRIARTRTTDAGLKHVARIKGLAHLNIANTAVTDAGLPYLYDLTNLRWLNLDNVDVTGRGIAGLKQRLPLCHICRGNWQTVEKTTQTPPDDSAPRPSPTIY